jgi:hypothetical protein
MYLLNLTIFYLYLIGYSVALDEEDKENPSKGLKIVTTVLGVGLDLVCWFDNIKYVRTLCEVRKKLSRVRSFFDLCQKVYFKVIIYIILDRFV